MLRRRERERTFSKASVTCVICCLSICVPALWQPARAEVIEPQEVDGRAAPAEMPADMTIAPASVTQWDLANAEGSLPPPSQPVSGPPLPDSPQPAAGDERYSSFGRQAATVKWEVAAFAAYVTALHLDSTIAHYESFHFQDEGWFGKSTRNLGVDKLTHAFNAYLLTEILEWRIRRKTHGAEGGPLTAAILAMGLVTYGEIYDGLKDDSGFSYQDSVFNLAGAGLSVLRNTVPGLKEKLDFRLLLIPNSDIYTFTGKRHYAQQRFLLALQFAGFEGLRQSPLRFVELHAGYYAKNFTTRERERGEIPQRKIFFGVGLNLQELFFRSPRSRAGRAARSVLDYLQLPYTAAHFD
jgi:hypothetical protein